MAISAASKSTAIDLPSRVEARDPATARVLGLMGAVMLLFAMYMTTDNRLVESANEKTRQAMQEARAAGRAVNPDEYPMQRPRWVPVMVFFCWISGFALLLYHAAHEIEPLLQRGYGILGFCLTGLGGMLATLAICSTVLRPGATLAVGGVFAALLALLTGAAFGRAARGNNAAGLENDSGAANNVDAPSFAADRADRWCRVAAIGLIAFSLVCMALFAVIRWGRMGLPETERFLYWLSLISSGAGLPLGLLSASGPLAPLGRQLRGLLGLGRRLLHREGNDPPPMLAAGLVVGFLAVVMALAAWLVRQPEAVGYYLHLLGYGLGCMGLGLTLLLAYNANEKVPAWRDAGSFLFGGLGFTAAGTGLASVFFDYSQYEPLANFLLPHGLVLGLLGLGGAWAFIFTQGSETERGHAAARIILALGAALLAAAVSRSIFQEGYFIPKGFLLTVLGMGQILLGACFAVDRPLMVMMRREFASLFYSPIAYVVIGGTALVAWMSFLGFSATLVTMPSPGSLDPTPRPVARPEPILISYLVDWYPVIFFVVSVPLVTMRLLSEERKSGTIETLLTAPVSEVSVVLSKFIGVWVFYVLAWGTWVVFPVALRGLGQETFDYWPMLSYFLGLACISAGFLAMGLFVSSLYRDQISAFLTSLVAMFVLTLFLYFFIQSWTMNRTFSPTTLAVLDYISTVNHLLEMGTGRLYYVHLLFHLSTCLFWLFLTVKVLEARKWR